MYALKRFPFYILVLVVMTGLYGCMDYQEIELVKVVDVKLKKVNTEGVDITAALQLKNPNRYSVKIVDSDLSVLVKGKEIGKATIKEKVTLPKNSNEVHHFTISTTITDMLSGALPLIMGAMSGKPIELHVSGTIKGSVKGLSKNVPVDFKEVIQL